MCFRDIIFAHTGRPVRLGAYLALFVLVSTSACTPEILLFTDPVTELNHPDIRRDLQTQADARVRQVSVYPFGDESEYTRSIPENVPVVLSLLASAALPESLFTTPRESAVVTIGGYAPEARGGLLVFDPGPAAAGAARFSATRLSESDELQRVCVYVLETGPAARRMRSEFVSEFTRLRDGSAELQEQRWFTDPGNEAVRGAVRDERASSCLMVFFLGERLSVALEVLDNRDVPVVIGADRVDYAGVDIVGWFDRPIAEALAAWYRDPETLTYPAHFQSSSDVSGL